MITTGKCPKCEKVMQTLVAETPELHINFQPAYKGATLLCPHCRTVVGASVDPVALKASIIAAIREAR